MDGWVGMWVGGCMDGLVGGGRERERGTKKYSFVI